MTTSALSPITARSAHSEWHTLVHTAMLGTDRKPLPAASGGWDAWSSNSDPALALLDRAAAVVAARRAGAHPAPAPISASAAPIDPRPICTAAATQCLAQLLRGRHDLLLPEWLARCGDGGWQPPPSLLPALLLRGKRHPAFDQVIRQLAGTRAAWLIEVMPELGLRADPATVPMGTPAFVPPAQPSDSGAVVSAIASAFSEGVAHWAAAPQLRFEVAAIAPSWLTALIASLNCVRFNAATERTRVDLIALAQFRVDMLSALAAVR